MSIKLHLSRELAFYAENRPQIEVNGKNVRECLDILTAKFPALKEVIESAKLTDRIGFFVNGEDYPEEDFTRPLEAGDEINILLHLG